MNSIERFLNYIQMDTMSNENSETCPSTEGQFKLAKVLFEELKSLGLVDVSMDEHAYVMATLPSNVSTSIPTVGFLSHMDTSDAMSGKGVKPHFIHYKGGDIILNKELNIVLSPKQFPELKHYIGQELIVTDGTTLLGADDKAGIAEIMTAIEHLVQNPDLKHGDIKIGFTPDEEIGRGADLFDVKKFGADFAYTVDGGDLGELEYETFNAASAKITIKGISVHPGSAKNKMVNAVTIATELAALLPKDQTPETTEGYEGFYHLVSINGDVENASMHYIIRDHSSEKFEKRKVTMKEVVEAINRQYGNEVAFIELKDQYYNMKEKIEEVYYIVELAQKSMKDIGVEPKIVPVRGGTDGSKLSFMGLPTPNLFTGGHNFHGKFEYIPTPSMEKAVEVILKIIENLTKTI